MATATINWLPGGGTIALSQDIHCKALADEVWAFIANVNASTNTAEVGDRLDNVVYQFRITNNCSGEVSELGNIAEGAHVTCPFPVNVNVDGMTLVGFFFPHVGGDVDSYFVELLSVDDEVLQTKTLAGSGFIIANFWGGLTPGTDYKMRVTPQATGELDVYSVVCEPVLFTTSPCPAPTDVTAEALVYCPAPTDVSAEAYVLAD
jgi:hypothetical protein